MPSAYFPSENPIHRISSLQLEALSQICTNGCFINQRAIVLFCKKKYFSVTEITASIQAYSLSLSLTHTHTHTHTLTFYSHPFSLSFSLITCKGPRGVEVLLRGEWWQPYVLSSPLAC